MTLFLSQLKTDGQRRRQRRTDPSGTTTYSQGSILVESSSEFRIEDESGIGFWDALIVASALKSGAGRILSEDLNAGHTIAGVRIENPFAELH